MHAIDEDELREFVVAAHRNGYAATDPETVEEAPGTVIEYREAPWEYVDRYVGSREFLGMEVVRRDGDAVWGMHYHGGPTATEVDSDRLYAFLRDALDAVSPEFPYRGPDGFAEGEYAYHVEVDGDLDRFDGVETICQGDEVVYRGRFAGGRVE